MIHASLPPATLSRLVAEGRPHFRPVYAAMQGAGVSLLLVRQGLDRFPVPTMPRGRGFVAVVGDDTDRAEGPRGFHRPSLRALAGAVRGVALIACEIIPEVYANAATGAALGRSGLIVETRPEREGEWLAFIQKHAPGAALLVCTCAAGTA